MSAEELPPDTPLIEPLTRREREILGLLAQGYSAPEMAEQLTLALSSVRWHIANVYGKLGVSGKRAALTHAKALGLLGQPAGAAPRHNLPAPLTRFFGRADEIASVRQRLTEWRLVTLTGAGGVGKTRLSLRVAEESLEDFPEGVWFVELASLTDPALVAPQTAAALGVRDEPGRPILPTMIMFLRERQALLVLDNCEHLLEACARLADSLLRACPRLSILASSRELLGIEGEGAFRVPSLPFPNPAELPAVERLAGYAAMELFVDRARAVVPDYGLAAHNAGSLARICQRLDGIPLALELAAARVSILTADELAERLARAFDLLTNGSRIALPRHRALRATIDWSYQLLTQAEQTLLQRLSVFAGGCTLRAAEAVCAGEGLPKSQVLPVLGSLVAKSMVSADQAGGEETRYRQLEMVQQFAHEKLAEAGEDARLKQRHHDYFLNWARARVPFYMRSERARLRRMALAEHDNLRQALEWSFSADDEAAIDPGLYIAFSSQPWPYSWQEDVDWTRRAVAWWQRHPDRLVMEHAMVLARGAFTIALNNPQLGVNWGEQAVAIARGQGARGKQLLMLHLSSLAALYTTALPDAALALAHLSESEAIFQELGPKEIHSQTLALMPGQYCAVKAAAANMRGAYREAKALAAQAVQIFQDDPSGGGAAGARMALGQACLNLGEYDEAKRQFDESQRLGAHLPDPLSVSARATALQGLGVVDFRQGHLEPAEEHFYASLRLAEQVPDRNVNAGNLGWLANLRARQGQPLVAATLAGASAAMWKRQLRAPLEDTSLDTLLPGWRERPDAAAIMQAFEAGQAMSADEAMAYALDEEPG